jgi:two-component system cell cycle response regulator
MSKVEETMSDEQGKILVVDDNKPNVELLQAHLESAGYVVITAFSGKEALARIASDKPDIILLDIMMPEMSGYEVCRRLKADPETKHTPVVMVTALHELEDVEKAVEVGADDFLMKPIHKHELFSRVKSMLRVKSLEDELGRTLSYLDGIRGEEGSGT